MFLERSWNVLGALLECSYEVQPSCAGQGRVMVSCGIPVIGLLHLFLFLGRSWDVPGTFLECSWNLPGALLECSYEVQSSRAGQVRVGLCCGIHVIVFLHLFLLNS